MSHDTLVNLKNAIDEAEKTVLEKKEQYNEVITKMLEAAETEHGSQRRIAEKLGVSRETLRLIRKRFYRSVIRYTDDNRALIMLPADDLTPDRIYEIRDTDKQTVLASGIPGRRLLDERREQLEEYLKGNPQRTNISMVDATEVIKEYSV